MAYRIVYGKDRRRELDYRAIFRFQILTALFLLGTAVGVMAYWKEGAAVLEQILEPGRGMAEIAWAWQSGAGVYDALAAFCRNVIYAG